MRKINVITFSNKTQYLQIPRYKQLKQVLEKSELWYFSPIYFQGPVSQSLPWKGPPLVKEGGFFSFGKATLKFSFAKLPLILLTKGLP